MQTYEMHRSVEEFHRKNNQLVGDVATTTKLPWKVKVLRLRLMAEELAETIIALHEGKELEFIDGLCDLSYVVVGTAVSAGILIPDCWESCPSAVLGKEGSYLTEKFRGDLALLFIEDGTRRLNMASSSIRKDDTKNLSFWLLSMQDQVATMASMMKVPFRECWREVHRANMSKNLGATIEGAKYGPANPKGEGFIPANLRQFLYA